MIRNKDIAKIWVYNAGIDRTWQDKAYGVRKVNDLNEQIMFNKQGEIVLFLTGPDDIVFLTEKPDKEFLEDIKKFGYKDCQMIILPNEKNTISEYLFEHRDILKNINQEKLYIYIPYILSIFDEKICESLNLNIYGSNADMVKIINDKMNARKIMEQLSLPIVDGYLCNSRESLLKAHDLLVQKGCHKFAIKEPYNSAGKGVYFIRDDKQFASFARMMRFSKDESFEISIEQWLENKRDINYQIEISEDGNVELIAITEQIISVTSYKGTIYPARLSSTEVEMYEKYAQIIGKKLFDLGYRGLVGIDSMINENGEIIPAIEFNARLNQSSFYLPIMDFFAQKNRNTLIRSYDIQTNDRLDYKRLKRLLKQKQIYYSEDTEEGIIILNSSSLSAYKDSKYHSRLFLGIVFEKNKDIKSQYNIMDEFVKYAQTL